MKTCPVRDLFDIRYGVNLELSALEQNPHGINFVSRISKNNGVSAKVSLIPEIVPIPAGTISLAPFCRSIPIIPGVICSI